MRNVQFCGFPRLAITRLAAVESFGHAEMGIGVEWIGEVGVKQALLPTTQASRVMLTRRAHEMDDGFGHVEGSVGVKWIGQVRYIRKAMALCKRAIDVRWTLYK